jgi:spore coat polysaccharide biosynthesis protein SpsF
MVKKGTFNIAILQARMSSSRLPGKVMMPVNGQPIIYRQIERIKQASTVDELIVATSTDPSDDSLAVFLLENGVKVYRGSLNDVISRFSDIQDRTKPTAIIRLTADCPLVIPGLIDAMVTRFYISDVDYLSNTLEPTYPDGLDVEVIRPSVFRTLKSYDLSAAEREHVTLAVYTRPSVFTLENFSQDVDLSYWRWTVDYFEDLVFVRRVYNEFTGRESTFTFEEILSFIANESTIRSPIAANRLGTDLSGTDVGE